MYLCEDGHKEICYDGRDCPLCEKLIEINDLLDQKYDLLDQITDLEEKLRNRKN